MVELWVECDPYTLRDGGDVRVVKQEIFCSIHMAVIQHFSKKVKRDLAGKPAKRVYLPFFRTPVTLVVDWMKTGGTRPLGTSANPYPRTIEYLKILRDLVVYLEIDQLIERIAKDIDAITPILPAPKRVVVPRRKPVQAERICYYCNKPGCVYTINGLLYSTHYDDRHIRRDCHDWKARNAVFVTKSDAEIYALDGTRRSIQSNGIHSRALRLHRRSLTQVQIGPKSGKVEPVARKTDTLEATNLSVAPNVPVAPNGTHSKVLTFPNRNLIHYETVPGNRKLRPASGQIIAFDEAGTRWTVEWNKVEIEVVGPLTSTECRITGTATTS